MKLMLPSKTIWEENPFLMNAIGLDKLTAPIVSVVGAGGKTSTIERLAGEYEKIKKKVIITTTTHMFQPHMKLWCTTASYDDLLSYFEKGDVVWVGIPGSEGKMRSPELSFFTQMIKMKIPILIEADGSKRLPLKVPKDNEPVILSESHMVIGILGMDALGKPLKEVCFRSELASQYLNKSENAPVTKEDYVEIIKNTNLLKKGITKDMKYIVILNKVDDDTRKTNALQIREILFQSGFDQVFLTSYQVC